MNKINKIFCFVPISADLFSVAIRQIWPIVVLGKNLFPNTNRSEPNMATFQVTNICNASCIFCAYPSAKMKKGLMKFDLFKQSLENLLEKYPIRTIDLTPTVGDPLVDPNVFEKIEFAKSKGLSVVLTTNAILSSKFSNEIIQSNLDRLFISLPSFEREDYKEVYGVDSCELVKDGLRKLIEAKERKFSIRLRFRNKIKPSKIIKSKFFQEVVKPHIDNGVSFNFTANFDNWGGTIKNLPKEMKMKPNFSMLKTPCLGLSAITVLFDGKIRSCGCRFIESDNDDLVIGHINEDFGIIEARANELIENFKLGKRPKTCQNCSFYNPNSKINI